MSSKKKYTLVFYTDFLIVGHCSVCVATMMNNSLNSLFILKVWYIVVIFFTIVIIKLGGKTTVGMLVGSFKKLEKYKFLLLCPSLLLALPTQSDNT